MKFETRPIVYLVENARNTSTHRLPYRSMATLGPSLCAVGWRAAECCVLPTPTDCCPRTASGAKLRPSDFSYRRVTFCTMSESRPNKPKTPLAVALVQGMAASARARYNVVPKITAYRWAEEPAVRATVGSTGPPTSHVSATPFGIGLTPEAGIILPPRASPALNSSLPG
jgi:hypothetical protein